MRISEKKKSDLYSAIREPIISLRISSKYSGGISEALLDEKLFKLEQQIWKEVKAALGVVE